MSISIAMKNLVSCDGQANDTSLEAFFYLYIDKHFSSLMLFSTKEIFWETFSLPQIFFSPNFLFPSFLLGNLFSSPIFYSPNFFWETCSLPQFLIQSSGVWPKNKLKLSSCEKNDLVFGRWRNNSTVCNFPVELREKDTDSFSGGNPEIYSFLRISLKAAIVLSQAHVTPNIDCWMRGIYSEAIP